MGIDVVVVECEVDMALGLPYFNVVGQAEGAVRESKVRVISALKNTGFELPQKRITVNLAPADLKKEGAAFELPIALGVLAAAKLMDEAPLGRLLFGGELSLDGGLRPIKGVLPLAVAALNGGFEGVMVPLANAAEAALVEGLRVFPVRTLREAVDHLTGACAITPYERQREPSLLPPTGQMPDMSDVRGQADLKLALEIAAAGGHNVLMSGPPGSGKTMLARRLPGILPEMTFAEAMEVTKVYSVLGLLGEGHALMRERPFRAPHHTLSDAGLVGGGPSARPGELSLAHNGVLFLDELPALRRNVLAGGHNVLMSGPPGSGKTMLARRLPGILPEMTFAEAMEVTKVYSVLGLLGEGHALMRERPFRAPHHTLSDAGLVGGGPSARPGELSLAHNGVLFLDELPEFRRNVLEVLRQPMEEGVIHLARANQNITYPCRVMLVAAMNPCPCGYYNVPNRPCTCGEQRVFDYLTRVSGPLLDRIDISIQTRPVEYHHMARSTVQEPSSRYYRERAQAARERQRARYRDEPGLHCNAQLPAHLLRRYCGMSERAEAMLQQAVRMYGLSARAHDRIVKLALTRADLEGHGRIEQSDMQLAINCRMLDRRGAAQGKLHGSRPAPPSGDAAWRAVAGPSGRASPLEDLDG
ncbi:Mg-chelatase subunits D/I family, ComM subfamily protein [Corallococcus macrosporus]|uniref:Mg-chelatase subunits D/I family, ComM subfamily protein n=2 Tax=Myxococcaceae TaxID=31 RepID=F8CCI1_MYXFH|nr:Mg-chelatase subunits D/I family, ComM subfamily protein [Corallococcus macrosporus]